MTDFSLERIYADAPVAHDDGRFISAKVSRIVELIRGYDPRLDVMWIPPDKRQLNDPAFVITERSSDGKIHEIFHVQSEEFMDERVLEQVYMADTAKHDVNGRIEAHNKAIRDAQALQARDNNEARLDLAKSLLQSPLHTYKHNGKTYRR